MNKILYFAFINFRDTAIYLKHAFVRLDGVDLIVTYVCHIGIVKAIVRMSHGSVFVQKENQDQTVKTTETLVSMKTSNSTL